MPLGGRGRAGRGHGFVLLAFLGVIDLLQIWHIGKQVEGWFKGFFSKKADSADVSSVAPDRYRARMQAFAGRLLVPGEAVQPLDDEPKT